MVVQLFPPVGGANANSRRMGCEFHLHIIKILAHFNREKVYTGSYNEGKHHHLNGSVLAGIVI